MTERERHDFTASELTDLRGLYAATVAALQTANAALEESIRVQQRLYATQQRLYARIAQLLGEAVGRPRVAPSGSSLSERLPPPLGTARLAPSDQQIQDDYVERRGGR